MLERVVNMFTSIKKLIALLLTVTFVFLAIVGRIDAQQFMSVFLMVIGAYFGQSIAKANAANAAAANVDKRVSTEADNPSAKEAAYVRDVTK